MRYRSTWLVPLAAVTMLGGYVSGAPLRLDDPSLLSDSG